MLKDNGVFIFEDPYVCEVLKKTTFDQIYDEHPEIYTPLDIKKAIQNLDVKTIKRLLNQLFHFSTCVIGYQGKREINLSFSNF